MSKEATKKFVENNGFICNKCGKVIVDGHKHKNEEDLCDQCKISDLEAKLAESESKVAIGRFWHSAYEGKQLDYDKLNNDYNKQEKLLSEVLADKSKLQFEFDQLKQQLAEKEKIIDWQSDLIEELKDYINYNVPKLIAANKLMSEKLAEKEKEIEKWKTKWCDSENNSLRLYEQNQNKKQDKISFAVEQLEKVLKHFVYCGNEIVSDYSLDCEIDELKAEIDNQIKQLKEGK